MIIFYVILHRVVIKYWDVSKEHTALIVRESELLQVYNEVTRRKNCVRYRGRFIKREGEGLP